MMGVYSKVSQPLYSMPTSFDCSCCCESFPIAKCIQCPGTECGFQVCIACQKTTLSLAHGCMSCKMTFTNKFLVEKLGKTFVNGALRKFSQEHLFEREKALLPETQPLVEWERVRRAEMDKVRFRQTPQIPPRPVVGGSGSPGNKVDPMLVVFPCPKNVCRGFVVRGKCGVCTDTVCVLCREVKATGHTCDPALAENVRALNTECKSCPQCATMIFRSEGCNHMACQACKSHFDWVTGRLLKASSNHHYDNVAAYSSSVARRGIVPSEMCEDDSGPALMLDHIPQDVFVEKITDKELISVLYDDPKVVRHAKRGKYMEHIIVSTVNNSLLVDRVKFMLGELTEAKWKSRIYTLEKHKDYDLHIAEVLNMYLVTVRDFQSYALRIATATANATATATATPLEGVKAEFRTFVQMCNESFASLSEEYGGALVKIRDDFSDPTLPAIIM